MDDISPSQSAMIQTSEEIKTCLRLAPKCAFILGHGRSGTTILAEMINAHPRAFLTTEANFYAERKQENFRSRYNRQHVSYNNQLSKSTYAPDFGGRGEGSWWEWLAAAAGHFDLVGDKMAFSPYHFGRYSQEDLMDFFEARFYDSKFVIIIRDPIQTILSSAKLFSADLEHLVGSWTRFIKIWADFIRIFPNTLTVLYEDFGVPSVEILEGFLGIDLGESSRLLDKRESRVHRIGDLDNQAPLDRFHDKLMAIYDEVRGSIAMPVSLRQADQKRVRALNDVSSSAKVAEIAIVPNPLGNVWLLATELLEEIGSGG